MRSIALTRGYVALVDDVDYDALAQHSWRALPSHGLVYAVRTGPRPDRAVYLMHRELLGLPSRTPEVDHIDGDGLNNQRANLRLATSRQNQQNGRARTSWKGTPPASRFKGVRRQRERWRADITVAGVKRSLGTFDNQEEAAGAYDAAARTLFGPFARTNIR